MPASDSPSSAAGLVAEAPAPNPNLIRHRMRVMEWRWLAPEIPDATESRLRRRARRQALAMMVASSCISVMALYGVWRLLLVLI